MLVVSLVTADVVLQQAQTAQVQIHETFVLLGGK